MKEYGGPQDSRVVPHRTRSQASLQAQPERAEGRACSPELGRVCLLVLPATAPLTEHARRFTQGQQTEDRMVLRAQALCKSGDTKVGRKRSCRAAQGVPEVLVSTPRRPGLTASASSAPANLRQAGRAALRTCDP